MRLGVALAFAAAPFALQLPATDAPDPLAVSALEKFLARPAIAHQYCAIRRLEASGGGHRGWMEVQTSFAPASGLAYEVTAEGGSGYIRGRVLRSLLDEEQRLLALKTASAAISPANYRLRPGGLTAERLVVVGLQPLRKDRALIAGQMLLTSDDGQLVRVEGRLAKNPSFWVTRVDVVRSYRPVNGVFLPVSLQTTAQLRFLGSSKLGMTYSYSRVDERAVNDEATDFSRATPPGRTCAALSGNADPGGTNPISRRR